MSKLHCLTSSIPLQLIPSLIQALEDQGFTEFVVSTKQTLLWIGIAILSGVIAAIIPAIRASRQNILEAISYE